MYRDLLLTALLLLTASAASAHEDRVLTVRGDGFIPEIPAQFSPATLKMQFEPTGSKVELQIKRHVMTVPPCITRLIKSKSLSDVSLSGSWYHDENRRPYYISVTFYAFGSPQDQATGEYTSILFNLRDASIIEVAEMTHRYLWFGRKYTRYAPQDLCRSTSMRPNNSFKPKPLRGSA